MKDRFGHGSNPGRGGGAFGHAGIQIAAGASFSRTDSSFSKEQKDRARRAEEDRANTVSRLRGQYREASGAGRENVVVRAFKNLLGS